MSLRVLSWSGTKGGKIAVSFDDEHFGAKEMQTEIELMHQVHPNLPDEVPLGTVFAFAKEEKTGHLMGRFRVGDTVYRKVAERSSLRPLWDTVGLIEQLVRPARLQARLLKRRLLLPLFVPIHPPSERGSARKVAKRTPKNSTFGGGVGILPSYMFALGDM